MKTIHFICTGNTYRSRLAEALFNAMRVPGWKASSSGVMATKNENGPISWYAMRLIKNNNLIPHMSFSWKQTTSEVLTNADHVVFLEKWHENICREQFGFDNKAYTTLAIADVDLKTFSGSERDRENRIIDITEETFHELQEEVKKLMITLA